MPSPSCSIVECTEYCYDNEFCLTHRIENLSNLRSLDIEMRTLLDNYIQGNVNRLNEVSRIVRTYMNSYNPPPNPFFSNSPPLPQVVTSTPSISPDNPILALLSNPRHFASMFPIATINEEFMREFLNGGGNTVPTLSEEGFSNLPINDSTEGDCVICTDSMNEKICCTLPCAHVFHRDCVRNWLVNNNASCPICRYNLLGGNGNEMMSSEMSSEMNNTGTLVPTGGLGLGRTTGTLVPIGGWVGNNPLSDTRGNVRGNNNEEDDNDFVMPDRRRFNREEVD